MGPQNPYNGTDSSDQETKKRISVIQTIIF